ncbi:filamentous hemagglutinin family N-terminal domain protein [Rivularia sp. PCC 7116]|uniref:two-partner secretion domain-containing protein n=1 Tax=Rivularia sp. PCC 7116 TaxID=373994 RepID=UPI00029F27FE|nr:filamentous hemagglutinin N-terminal domain-containing protein [Rivularia sp. PCC 7116]AFY55541.1 filamentous hemagglutinin family N-terminal domain protein [Rivularia sp. PCC 7116]
MTIIYGLNKCLYLNLVGFLGCLGASLLTTKTLAEQSNITPDNTLGAESSRLNRDVTINGINADRIDGGARRDSNLFHSFSEFNINDGQRVYFVNPSGVENILTRVTGGNASNIFGALGVDGAANLFLINPNGIVFGENSSLDLQGSFVGTTASGIQFGEQGSFSATNPEMPGNLTVNPSALFFNQVQASGGIINKSQAPAGINPEGDETTGLRVPDGKSLLLVGGNINFDGGRLKAYEGNIELASVSAPGTVDLDIAGDSFSLNIPEDVERGDISLTNIAAVSVFGAGGGNFIINARNLEISNSFIFAGISGNSVNPETQAGDVNLNATDSILLKDGAGIDNSVYSQGNAGNISLQASNSIFLVDSIIVNNIEAGGIGKGGNISINAGSLSLNDGSQIQATLDNADVETNLLGGQGNAGNININVRDAVTINGIKDGISSDISSFVGIGAVGNAGDININTGSLTLAEGSEINAKTSGQGNAGNIIVNASQNISLDGSGDVTLRDGSNGTLFTRIISSVNPESVGNAGNIQLNTGTLSVTDGAFISSSINGKGDSGNITINARDTVTFDTYGFAGSNVFTGGVGKGGDIWVTTGTLSLKNGGQLSTNVSGEGNAGNIFVEAKDNVELDSKVGSRTSSIDSSLLATGLGKGGDIQITTGLLSVSNGAQITAFTDGQGNAGNITINASDKVIFDGFDASSGLMSIVSTNGSSNSVGNGGDIRITTGEFLLKNGGIISTANFGKGNAGNIFLDVGDTITFDGVGSNKLGVAIPSSARSTVSNGNAGNIEVKTGSLFLTNGGDMSVEGFPEENSNNIANGGDITINARESIKFDGKNSGLSTALGRGTGKSGDIQITTGSLSVTNGAVLFAATSGLGNAGNININARDTVTFDRGFAFNVVNSNAIGDSGDIEITTGSLFLDNRGFLSTETGGKGDAGKVKVDAADSIALSNSSQITSNVFTGGEGKGGAIDLDTQTLTLTGGSTISASSNGTGGAGNIEVQAGIIKLDNSSIFAQTAATQGGNITLNVSEKLVLRNSSQISTTAGIAQAGGDGGNIDINSKFIVVIPEENSDITANAFEGSGGKVNITSEAIFGIESRSQPTDKSDITASSQRGISGETSINQDDTSSIQNSFTGLSPNIDTDAIIANSCIARGNKRQENSLRITGSGALRSDRAGNIFVSKYATGKVRTVESNNPAWKKGDAIVEPQGLYRLKNGELLLSRECSD